MERALPPRISVPYTNPCTYCSANRKTMGNKVETNPSDLEIKVHDDVKIRENIRLRGKRNGQRKVTSQIESKDDFHRDANEWRHIDRVIDKENNHYKEIIKDENGSLVRQCEEALTKHQGRGSAKKKLNP
ncbi:MAG: hypothetical protein GY721_10200 [Deltaproteobacteria bacterium]|nr:hypothetical protein [Deltaproteobacteria bacterium]